MNIQLDSNYSALKPWLDNIKLNFSTQGEVLQTGRNEVRKIVFDSQPIVIKSYKTPNILQSFVYGFIRKSKAQRSYIYSQRLTKLGISNPRAICYIEYTAMGCIRESYYLSEGFQYDYNLREFFASKPAPEKVSSVVKEIAKFTYLQHQNGVLHLDYNPTNILMRPVADGHQLAMIDFNRMAFKNPSMSQRAKSLIHLSTDQLILAELATEYAKLHATAVEPFCKLTASLQQKVFAQRQRLLRFKRLFK